MKLNTLVNRTESTLSTREDNSIQHFIWVISLFLLPFFFYNFNFLNTQHTCSLSKGGTHYRRVTPHSQHTTPSPAPHPNIFIFYFICTKIVLQEKNIPALSFMFICKVLFVVQISFLTISMYRHGSGIHDIYFPGACGIGTHEILSS
jgi:hypothetical protein